MNNLSLEKMSINISNGWIIGCSILTSGIITYAYLDGLSNLPIIHMKRKYMLKLQQIDNSIDLTDKIINEDKIIRNYWNTYNAIYITAISGISIVIIRSIID